MRRNLVLVPLVLTLLATGCSSGDSLDGDADQSSRAATDQIESPPALDAGWTQNGDVIPPTFSTVPFDGSVQIDQDAKQLGAVDLATGEKIWTTRVPQPYTGFCSVSTNVIDHTIGALLKAKGKPCTIAAAFDTRTGKVLWTRNVPGEPPYHEGRNVQVGPDTLLMTLNCSEVRRFGLRTGRVLGVIAPQDRKCAMETATDGRVIAVLNDPETAETPDDLGTGFIPPHDAKGAFELYDASTGKRLWRREIENTRGAGMNAVLSSSPTILAFSEAGHAVSRRVDANGRPRGYVGMEFSSADEPPVLIGRSGNTLVVEYPGAQNGAWFAYDVRSGKQLWRLDLSSVPGLDPAASKLFIDDAGIVVASPALVPSAEGSRFETWLYRFDLADPTQVSVLGSAPGQPTQLAAGYLATAQNEDGATTTQGFAIPATGESGNYEIPDGARPKPVYAEDELRSSDVAQACAAVSKRSLRLLGILRGDLPLPANCVFRENEAPSYLERELKVDVKAVPPSTDANGEPVSATQTATDLLAEYEGAKKLTAPALSDEAFIVDANDSTLVGPAARLVVRYRNVLIDIQAQQDLQVSDRGRFSVPDDQVDVALLAATTDVLTELGAPAPDAVPIAGGRYSAVGDTCGLLGPTADSLLAAPREVDATPRGQKGRRVSACEFREPEPLDEDDAADYLEVSAYAVPGSPLGYDAEANALRLSGIGKAGKGEKIRGLGPHTDIDTWVDRKFGTHSVDVETVVDNLVVTVHYTDFDEPRPLEEMKQEAIEIARYLVRSSA